MEKKKPSYIMSSKLEEFCKNNSDNADIVYTMLSDSNRSLSDIWLDLNTPDTAEVDLKNEEDLMDFYHMLVARLEYIDKEILKRIAKNAYEKFLLISSMKNVADTLVHSDMTDYENLGDDDNRDDRINEYISVSVNEYDQYVNQYNNRMDSEMELLSLLEKSDNILEIIYEKITSLEESHPEFKEKEE